MKASVVTVYDGPEVMKYQDMPDPRPGAGDVLVRLPASASPRKTCASATATRRISIARRAVVSRTTTPMCGRASRRSSRTSDQAKIRRSQQLLYGAVSLCYRLRGYSESMNRVTTRASVLNYSTLVSFLRTITATAKCKIEKDMAGTLRAKLFTRVRSAMIDKRYGRYVAPTFMLRNCTESGVEWSAVSY